MTKVCNIHATAIQYTAPAQVTPFNSCVSYYCVTFPSRMKQRKTKKKTFLMAVNCRQRKSRTDFMIKKTQRVTSASLCSRRVNVG
ncbi:hypothetical protein XELAEV_18043474mg [Xenopus laevis]|uniref:Uncharacterized protein n=1 Tax=Xenopus laevis TaxID=8355 RepID=A0A974BX27_XENLA|nr:hypothetical protein XELAEV_18043474mg [Xenopus laevis]